MLCARFCLILCLSLSVGYGRLLFLVNRAKLWSVDDMNIKGTNLHRSLEYRYIDGDVVDISCVSLGRSKAVKLIYNLEEYVSYDMKKYNGGVGLRTTLQQAHDRTIMSCKYYANNYNILLNVTFILQNTFDDLFYLKINGYTLRLEKNITVYAVYYLDEESLQMECKTKDGDISLVTSKYYVPHATIPEYTNKTSLKFNPKKYRYFTYVATSTLSKCILRMIDILFEPLPKVLTDNTILKLNTTSSNTLINLYAYNGSQLIYYGYKEGDSLSLNCSTYIEFIPGIKGYYLNFDRTEERNKSHIIKHLQLTAADANKTITCRLFYIQRNIIILRREIHVLFRMRYQGDTFAGQQNQTWILAVVVAAICIVFVACGVVCYMKTRNDRLQEIGAGDTNLDDQQCDNHTSVQTYSAQPEAMYVDPIRQTHEDTAIYSNMQHHELEAISHTKIPVSTSQEGQTTSDLNYAVLDISQPGKDLNNSDTEESPYAEIYQDDNALLYTNVPYKRRKDD